jgi:hypothetical protein
MEIVKLVVDYCFIVGRKLVRPSDADCYVGGSVSSW